MTKSEIFKSAHEQARSIKAVSYAEAFKYGLRRVYNQIQTDAFIKAELAKPATPKFMWLRGW